MTQRHAYGEILPVNSSCEFLEVLTMRFLARGSSFYEFFASAKGFSKISLDVNFTLKTFLSLNENWSNIRLISDQESITIRIDCFFIQCIPWKVFHQMYIIKDVYHKMP